MTDITECPHCGCIEFLTIGVLGTPPNWDIACGTYCRGGTIYQSDGCRISELHKSINELINAIYGVEKGAYFTPEEAIAKAKGLRGMLLNKKQKKEIINSLPSDTWERHWYSNVADKLDQQAAEAKP